MMQSICCLWNDSFMGHLYACITIFLGFCVFDARHIFEASWRNKSRKTFNVFRALSNHTVIHQERSSILESEIKDTSTKPHILALYYLFFFVMIVLSVWDMITHQNILSPQLLYNSMMWFRPNGYFTDSLTNGWSKRLEVMDQSNCGLGLRNGRWWFCSEKLHNNVCCWVRKLCNFFKSGPISPFLQILSLMGKYERLEVTNQLIVVRGREIVDGSFAVKNTW